MKNLLDIIRYYKEKAEKDNLFLEEEFSLMERGKLVNEIGLKNKEFIQGIEDLFFENKVTETQIQVLINDLSRMFDNIESDLNSCLIPDLECVPLKSYPFAYDKYLLAKAFTKSIVGTGIRNIILELKSKFNLINTPKYMTKF